MLVMGANHGIALPVAYLRPGFKVGRPLANGSSAHNLASTLPAAGIALFPFLLATQLFPKTPACGLIGVDMAVDGLMPTVSAICTGLHFSKRQSMVLSQSAVVI